jgi:hypothetical protein
VLWVIVPHGVKVNLNLLGRIRRVSGIEVLVLGLQQFLSTGRKGLEWIQYRLKLVGERVYLKNF